MNFSLVPSHNDFGLNFDGVSDANDLAMFESMWNWSISENGRTVPNYTVQGTAPYLRILNGQLIVRFPLAASTAQFYFEYDTEKYLIDYLSSNLSSNVVLSANSQEDGIIQVEAADYRTDRTSPLEMAFSFQNLTDNYEFMRVSYSSYSKSNLLVSEGYNLIQTAPSTYRLSQSYPNPFTEDGTTIRRRRLCVCGQRFTTFERVQFRELTVIKKNGRKSSFDREKLSKSRQKIIDWCKDNPPVPANIIIADKTGVNSFK